MCYGIEDVRQERIDILLEVQRIGVDALVLDFCRQMPMVMYLTQQKFMKLSLSTTTAPLNPS